jgi:virginiamycin B lyase
LLGISPATAAQQYGIIERTLLNLTLSLGPDIGTVFARGPDGNVWFVPFNEGPVIDRITQAGVITQFTTIGAPGQLTAGPDGALWFTLGTGTDFIAIGRMTTAGVSTSYNLPHHWVGSPLGIASGPDDTIWFTAWHGIGYITTSGTIVQRESSSFGVDRLLGPMAIGSDGALWFAHPEGIGRCTRDFVCTNFSSPDPGASSWALGSDGAIWTTGECPSVDACKVGRISTDGAFTFYPVPGIAGPLSQIAAGGDGALWLGAPGQIVRMTTSGTVTAYPLPNSNAFVTGIVRGPEGMWFAELELTAAQLAGSRLGEVVPVGASLAADPTNWKPGENVTLTGSGFASGETVNLHYSADIGKELPSTVMADSTGAFVVTGAAGPSPFGDASVEAIGQSSGKLGVATVLVVPRLIVSPTSGSVGDTITVSGTGFPVDFGFSTVQIYWLNPKVKLGTVTVDVLGQFTGFTFAIPADAPAGEQAVVGTLFQLNGSVPSPPNGNGDAYVDVLASSPSE